MDDAWIKMLPQGAAVSAVIAVVGMILLKYIPTLIHEFKDTVQGIVTQHAATLKEERDLFRGELKELRTVFKDEIKQTTDAFSRRDEVMTSRIDTLTLAHRELNDSVKDLRNKLEK